MPDEEIKTPLPYNREKAIPQIINELLQSGKDMMDIYNDDINRRIFEIYGITEDSKILSNWKYRYKQQLAKKDVALSCPTTTGRFDDLRRFIKCRDMILKVLQPIRIESGLSSDDFKELVRFSLEDLG